MASIKQMGPRSWRVLIRKAGQRALCRTFRTEEEARKFAAQAEKDIREGKAPDRSGDTIAAAVGMFRELRESIGREVKRASTEHYMLEHLADPDGIGRVPIYKLTPQRLAEWCRERAEDGAGPCTVGMEISKLKTVLKYAAISMKTVLPDVVGAAMPLLEYGGLVGASQHRDRRPKAAELAALWPMFDPTMADIVRFAIATGMRRGEIIRILWDDVDTDRRLVLVRDRKHPRKKAGNHQLVPLIDRTGFDAWAILQRQPKVDKRIFPVTGEYVSDSFTDACRRAEIKDLHFHDLRHHATSLLFESGLEIQQVALVTGHRDWRNLRRYTHLKPESLAAANQGTPPRPDSERSESRPQDTSAP